MDAIMSMETYFIKIKYKMESQIIIKSLRARKQKDINRIVQNQLTLHIPDGG
jgi:hypothetical protein